VNILTDLLFSFILATPRPSSSKITNAFDELIHGVLVLAESFLVLKVDLSNFQHCNSIDQMGAS
jgi:hypothetical protein